MIKLLTVIVPAYNSELWLRGCLESLVCGDSISMLDVIVVNDGSSDATKSIAKEFVDRFPESFRVVNKPNGGHGSAINTGTPMAKGKYLRILDSDDKLSTENIPTLLDFLSKTDADVVIMNFCTVNIQNCTMQKFETSGFKSGVVYDIREFSAKDAQAFKCCTIHGLTYRTEMYIDAGIKLTEGVFYEDNEFSTLPFLHAETVLPLDLQIYEYTVGCAEQSVSTDKSVARIGQLERVFWRIYEEVNLNSSDAGFFQYKLSEILRSYYTTMLIKNSDRKNGLRLTKEMRRKVLHTAPFLQTEIRKQYKLLLFLHYCGISVNLLEKIKLSRWYTILHRILRGI